MSKPVPCGPPILIIPGLGGSGPDHWQSLWQRDLPGARRVEQANWTQPVLDDWLQALRREVEKTPGAVAVCHSLGCILLAHLLVRYPASPLAAALLVAPADVEAAGPERQAVKGFAPLPLVRLPFPSIVVASSNDPFASADRVAVFAQAWGSTLIEIGACGHINVAAGFGSWPEGRAILDRLVASPR